MRQQSRLVENALGHLREVRERSAVAWPEKRFAHFREDGFGAVAEAKERFLAAGARARNSYRHHFVGRHHVRARLDRVFAKSAVAAVIAAQVCERYEYFF